MLAVGVYVSVEHPGYTEDSRNPIAKPICNVSFDYPLSIGSQNKDKELVKQKLGVSASEMSAVHWFPAECATKLPGDEFAQGLVGDSDSFQPSAHQQSYEHCVLYGVSQQMLAAVGRRDRPAILACFNDAQIVQI
jgi:hypothetical protein